MFDLVQRLPAALDQRHRIAAELFVILPPRDFAKSDPDLAALRE